MIRIGYNDSSKHKGSFDHPEKPDRVNFCISKLKNELNPIHFINVVNKDICDITNAIKSVHSSKHIENIANFETKGIICRNCDMNNWFKNKKNINDLIIDKKKCITCDNIFNLDNVYCCITYDTFYTGYTYNIAIEAIGIIMELLDTLKFNIGYVFALVRPPGHHCNNDPNGFCIFNNALIGAKYALKLGFQKVLILDVDFHHGDGTQELLESETNSAISYVSIHGYGKNIYPGTGYASNLEKNILNIPLIIDCEKESREYITDDYYQSILDNNVFPFIKEKNPDLIIVSLGFDAHQSDPLEGMNITDLTYIYLTLRLKQYGSRVMFLLEGGYNIKTIGRVIPQMISLLE